MTFVAIPILCTFVFVVFHFGLAASRPERIFTFWDAIMGLWCISYAVFALGYAQLTGVITSGPGGPSIDIGFTPVALFVMIPTIITSVIAWLAWRSIHFVWVMFLAGATSVYLSIELQMLGLMLLAPVVWNSAYTLTCMRLIRETNRVYDPMM
jgi:hypothetical protein